MVLMFRQDAPANESEVLKRCHEHAASGRFTVSQAAHERLQADRLSPADLRQLLATADRCERSESGGSTWRISGRTIDGAESDAIVTFDSDGLTVL